MGKTNVNRENLLCVQLLRLRRHLNSCKQCRSARKVRDYTGLCEVTRSAIVEIAVKWDNNIAGRLAARNGMHEYIFPCPDPNAHGPAYALTAEAVIITAHQESLI